MSNKAFSFHIDRLKALVVKRKQSLKIPKGQSNAENRRSTEKNNGQMKEYSFLWKLNIDWKIAHCLKFRKLNGINVLIWSVLQNRHGLFDLFIFEIYCSYGNLIRFWLSCLGHVAYVPSKSFGFPSFWLYTYLIQSGYSSQASCALN